MCKLSFYIRIKEIIITIRIKGITIILSKLYFIRKYIFQNANILKNKIYKFKPFFLNSYT